MKRLATVTSICIATVLFTILAPSSNASSTLDDPLTEISDGTYLIKYKDPYTDKSDIEKAGGYIKKINEAGDLVIAELPLQSLSTLKENTSIKYIEPNHHVKTVVMDEPTPPVPETVPYGIQMVQALEAQASGYTAKGIKIAVLDSGYSYNSDLKINGGYSFISDSNNYADDYGHGTHVAGTIAAAMNGEGTLGVAPQADIYAIKVLDQSGRGSYYHVIEGIDWAIKHKMNIVNISFGGERPSQILEEKVQEASDAGILLVASAGNDGYMGEDTILYPAKYPAVLAVGAVDSNHNRAFFSAKGSALDLMAPGVKVWSTLPNNRFGIKSGTSMAAPHVTGTAALIMEKNKKLDATNVVDILLSSAKPLGGSKEYGHGLVQAKEALEITPLP
jgi:subtilisin